MLEVIMTIIRNAAKDDVDSIYEFMNELEEVNFDQNTFTDNYFKNLLSTDIVYLVAVNNDIIVGFISIYIQYLLHHNANIAEIQELFVKDDQRNLKIGQQLFTKAKEIALQNNCSQIEVTTNQKRIQSQNFYLKQGMINTHYKFTLML